MANRQRGEVEVRGSDGETRTFRLGSGALCQLEEALNLDIMELFKQLTQGKMRLSMIREFVKASSVDKPDMTMTNDEAHQVIDACGVMPLIDAMTDSILVTFNVKKGKEGADPQKPARGKAAAGAGSLKEPQRKAS